MGLNPFPCLSVWKEDYKFTKLIGAIDSFYYHDNSCAYNFQDDNIGTQKFWIKHHFIMNCIYYKSVLLAVQKRAKFQSVCYVFICVLAKTCVDVKFDSWLFGRF